MTMTLITTTSISSIETTISSIPSTFTDLLVVGSLRLNDSRTNGFWYVKVNGSTSGYSGKLLYGTGGNAYSADGADNGAAFFFESSLPGSAATTGTFNSFQLYFPNYAGSTTKSMSADTVQENNAPGAYQVINAGLWNSTAAITSITFGNYYASFQSGSTVSIYGIKKGTGGATVS